MCCRISGRPPGFDCRLGGLAGGQRRAGLVRYPAADAAQLERVERQRDIERERTRIARDIHDDLGAHLTRITMISESARGDLDNPVRAVTGLESNL